jgi:hypothetical protein
MQVWDKDFIKVDDETIFNLILAANYLDIKALLDLTVIRIKTTPVICAHLNSVI